MTDIPKDWKAVTATEDVRIVSTNGTKVVRIAAGETKYVHPDLFAPAITAGCTGVSGAPLQQKSHEEIVEELVDVMEKIMAVGDETSMTKHDGPRVATLKMHVPEFTEAQRAEAWAILSDAPGEEPEDE